MTFITTCLVLRILIPRETSMGSVLTPAIGTITIQTKSSKTWLREEPRWLKEASGGMNWILNLRAITMEPFIALMAVGAGHIL